MPRDRCVHSTRFGAWEHSNPRFPTTIPYVTLRNYQNVLIHKSKPRANPTCINYAKHGI